MNEVSITFDGLNTSLPQYIITNNFQVEECELYWNVNIPIPGLDGDDITVKVKNSVLIVEIPEGTFTPENNYMWDFPYKLKSKNITASIDDGVITITVEKPKDSEFEVEIK